MSSFVCTLETIGITLANPMSIPGQAGEHSDKNNKISSISADLLSLGTGSGKDLHPEEDLLSFSYPTPDTSLPPSNHLATLQATYPPVLGFDQRAAAIAKEKCVLLQAFTAEACSCSVYFIVECSFVRISLTVRLCNCFLCCRFFTEYMQKRSLKYLLQTI